MGSYGCKCVLARCKADRSRPLLDSLASLVSYKGRARVINRRNRIPPSSTLHLGIVRWDSPRLCHFHGNCFWNRLQGVIFTHECDQLKLSASHLLSSIWIPTSGQCHEADDSDGQRELLFLLAGHDGTFETLTETGLIKILSILQDVCRSGSGFIIPNVDTNLQNGVGVEERLQVQFILVRTLLTIILWSHVK